MEWEDTKENFVPAKHGHSAAALSTPLSVTKGTRELEHAKRIFLEDIKTADDPLAAWQRYIKWTQEQFAAQGGKSQLQQVLETATKSLSSTSRYNNDVRLLRIWVQYADCLPDPSDVFLYLENQNIGRDHALLYEAYATYLELKGNFQQAGLVYQEGINRLAKPLERLKQKHAAFKQRMEKRIQRQTSEALLGMESATAAADASRARATLAPVPAPLGRPQLDENGNQIRSSRQHTHQRHSRPPAQTGSSTAGIRPAAGSSSGPSLFGSSSSSTAAPSAAGGLFGIGSSRHEAPPGLPMAPIAAAAAANGAKLFDVLVDEEFGPSGSGVQPTAFPAGHNPLSQLPGYKLGRKENTTEAAEWAGQKLKQQSMYTAPTANRLEVFEDDDFAEPQEAAAAAAAVAQQQQQQVLQQQSTLRKQLEAPLAEAESQSSRHVSAPQKGLGVPFAAVRPAAQLPAAGSVPETSRSTSSSRSSSSRSSSSAGSNTAAAAAGASAPQGYNAALLLGPNGGELSFEENRAAAWRAKRARQLQQQEEQRKQHQAEQQQKLLAQQRLQEEEEQRKRIEEQQRQQAQQRQQEALKAAEAAAAAAAQKASEAAAAQKASEAAAAAKANEAAAAAARQQQQQAVLLSRQQQQQQPPGTYSTAEPTVTINTRAALDSLNFMFSQDLPTMTLPRNAIASASAQGLAHPSAAGMRSRKSMSGMGAEPTVTLNTRAALEAMNGMFDGGDDTMTMHGFEGPGRGMAPARPGRAAGNEPTVTINTRQAFDCLNDMFGDVTGQQTMTGRQMMAGRVGHRGGNSRLSTAAASAAGGWQLHEDTELLQNTTRGVSDNRCTSGLGPGVAGGSMGWEVREDTEFVSTNGRPVEGGLGMGLGLCEDTEFLTRPIETVAAAAAAAGTQYAVYEDTDYLNVPAVQAMSGLNRLSLANRAAGMGNTRGGGLGTEPPGGLGLSLHEDTDLLTSHTAAANAAAGGGSRSNRCGNRGHAAAAVSIPRGEENVPAGHLGLGLHEDTDLLATHSAAAAREFGRSASSSAGISRGHTTAGFSGSRDTENAPGPLSVLGLHEDTELLACHSSAAPTAAAAAGKVDTNRSVPAGFTTSADFQDGGFPVAGTGLGLHEDTELLQTYGSTAAPGTISAQAGSSGGSGSSSSRAYVPDDCSDTTTGLLRIKENLPAAAAPRAHRAPFGSAAATGAPRIHGSSRLGHSSAPGSPVGHRGAAAACRTDSTPGKPPLGSTTPGKYQTVSANATPNRGPRTPGTPWAQPMDEFEVMESPAVREAWAGRPMMQMSPAASMPSPGVGSVENLPSGNDDARLKPRSMRDRASRAAALQPLSDSRAELLGVHMDPSGEAAEGDEEVAITPAAAAGAGGHSLVNPMRADGKPNALRSLRFHG